MFQLLFHICFNRNNNNKNINEKFFFFFVFYLLFIIIIITTIIIIIRIELLSTKSNWQESWRSTMQPLQRNQFQSKQVSVG